MTGEQLKAQAKLDAEASQRQENFLSPWIEKHALHFRQSNQEWYDYARELNRVGLAIWTATENVVVARSTFDPLCIAVRLLLRALCDFEASVILAERGIVDQADMLTRSIYEAGFWMGYLNRDGSNAAAAMLNDSYASRLRALRFNKKLAVSQHGGKAETVRKIDKEIACHEKGKSQNIPELALLAGYEEFYYIYKELSSAVAHTSLHSLHSFMNANGDGTFDGHIIGPSEGRISPSLSNACLALCLNLRSYSEIVGGSKFDNQLNEMLLLWDTIPKSWAPKVGG